MRLRFIVLVCLVFFNSLSSEAFALSTDSLVYFECRFDLDKHQLSSNQKARIDSLLKKVPVNIIKNITIYGHTDSLADVEYNRKLSRRRVQSVLKYFVYQGLDPINAQTDFYGEEKPAYANTPEERFKNRRVEVLLSVDASLLPMTDRRLSDYTFKTGDRLRISNLNFVPNQPVPVSTSYSAFEELLKVMNENPDLELSLRGHVCCSNDFELSVARSRMVYDFLIDHGITKNRLDYKGFGNKVPLFDEIDDESEALNRRVEIEVLFNSEERQEYTSQSKLQIEAPLMDIKFNDASARLSPSGDFMLTLVADMIKDSEGLVFHFSLYDNIGDAVLSSQRANTLEKTLRKKGVPNKLIKVQKLPIKKAMPRTPDYNWIMVEIKQKGK
jgi:outer membrane protein OmpA-like peptidoglycan-associated protein